MLNNPIYRPVCVELYDSRVSVSDDDLYKIVNSKYAGLCNSQQYQDCNVIFTCNKDVLSTCMNCLVSKRNYKNTKNLLKKSLIERLKNVK